MNRQQQRFTRYILSQSTSVTSFQYLGFTVPEKSVMKILIFETWKEKFKKGMNKQQQQLDCDIHDTPTHCSCVY